MLPSKLRLLAHRLTISCLVVSASIATFAAASDRPMSQEVDIPASILPEIKTKRVVTVGTAKAAPGDIARGFITVPTGSDPGYQIPVIVINGVNPGPTLALIAGLHGTEFGGVVALQKLSNQLDPKDLSGAVIVVPLANIASFERLVPHLNPVDGKNMNRVFPGNVAGTQSERAAFSLTSEVISQADYVIDYHGGDLDEDQQPYMYWIQTGHEPIDSIEHEMLLAFGIDYIIKFSARDLKPATANLLPTQAVSLGKPTITVDAGRAGAYTSSDLDTLLNGTLNVMGRLRILGRSALASGRPAYFARTLYVNSEKSGTFFPLVQRGEYVSAGARLGYVADHFGQTIFQLTAPEAGVVLYLNSTPSVMSGAQLFYLGILE